MKCRVRQAHARGFTLVELIVTLAVLVTLAVAVIPRFLRARYSANEAAAVATLKTCVTALEAYRSAQSPPSYPEAFGDLSDASPPYIPATVTGGATKGYTFSYEQADQHRYTITAAPESEGVSGARIFFADESGVIRLDDADGEPVQ